MEIFLHPFKEFIGGEKNYCVRFINQDLSFSFSSIQITIQMLSIISRNFAFFLENWNSEDEDKLLKEDYGDFFNNSMLNERSRNECFFLECAG